MREGPATWVTRGGERRMKTRLSNQNNKRYKQAQGLFMLERKVLLLHYYNHSSNHRMQLIRNVCTT